MQTANWLFGELPHSKYPYEDIRHFVATSTEKEITHAMYLLFLSGEKPGEFDRFIQRTGN